jgi:LmbE family N-acetylglucosaminyl deacetylase
VLLRPAFIVDISTTWDLKARSLACYASQLSPPPSPSPTTSPPTVLENVDASARWWGSMIGVARGEPFTSREPIGLRGFGDLF